MAQPILLLNETLGKEFRPYRGNKKLTVAAGWSPWWLSPSADDAPRWQNRQPVYDSFRLDERLVQQLSTPFGTHTAGLRQQIPAAEGNEYEFVAEGQAWSSESNEPASQLEASDVNLQIGIDPTGGLDPTSPLIIWSESLQPLSQWETLRLTVTAESTIITLFLKSAPNLPKRQQSVFWRNVRLRPIGRYKRSVNIIGTGDTHIVLEPERPQPSDSVTVTISSNREHQFTDLFVQRPSGQTADFIFHGKSQDADRFAWRYEFKADGDGLYDIRFIGDEGARLLALRLLQVSYETQIVPSDEGRLKYQRVYVLLPPTADKKWLVAAAKGGFNGRYTIGFSADDAGIGNIPRRHVLAINPHHWPDVLTDAWFQQHYPGVAFTAVVANTPEDLEAWLKTWEGDQ